MRKAKQAEPSNAASSERRNWGNIFNSMVQMVRSQQNQLQSFANNHKFLEERLRVQHEGWVSDVRFHKDQISQMKGILMSEEKKRLLEAAKADLSLGFKHREASLLKWILELTEDELADFKAWFEFLSRNSSNGENQGAALKETDMKNELRSLKDEYDKLALEKSSEVSALLAEKKFVWNQYNIMETNYTNILRTKEAEVENANEKINVLVSRTEQLQSENNEKDSKISGLESKVADMEAERKKLSEEISGLSVELESLRRLKNNQVTPVLNRCMEGTKKSTSGIVKSSMSRRNMTKKESTPNAPAPGKSSEKAPVKSSEKAPVKSSDKGTTSLKRKEGPDTPTTETPKLFSSSFKVPKLKPSLKGSHDRCMASFC
ncbi:hypothetical protein RJT34_14519 [Clitoria ternatea]|uniref:Uncharacterized protein n=1 Tax=Clitoria ternatea TaxID=43366 RepID=A0AAN9JU39_CLITE